MVSWGYLESSLYFKSYDNLTSCYLLSVQVQVLMEGIKMVK